jgi:hypothetical protein
MHFNIGLKVLPKPISLFIQPNTKYQVNRAINTALCSSDQLLFCTHLIPLYYPVLASFVGLPWLRPLISIHSLFHCLLHVHGLRLCFSFINEGREVRYGDRGQLYEWCKTILFSFLWWVRVHCGIDKISYSASNISAWIHPLHHSPLSSSLPHSWSVSTGIIFLFTYMCTQYLH